MHLNAFYQLDNNNVIINFKIKISYKCTSVKLFTHTGLYLKQISE